MPEHQFVIKLSLDLSDFFCHWNSDASQFSEGFGGEHFTELTYKIIMSLSCFTLESFCIVLR